MPCPHCGLNADNKPSIHFAATEDLSPWWDIYVVGGATAEEDLICSITSPSRETSRDGLSHQQTSQRARSSIPTETHCCMLLCSHLIDWYAWKLRVGLLTSGATP